MTKAENKQDEVVFIDAKQNAKDTKTATTEQTEVTTSSNATTNPGTVVRNFKSYARKQLQTDFPPMIKEIAKRAVDGNIQCAQFYVRMAGVNEPKKKTTRRSRSKSLNRVLEEALELSKSEPKEAEA